MLFNVKKRFFKRELKRTQANIWGNEFARFGALVKRETMRQQYDIAEDAVNRLSGKPDKTDQEKENLQLAEKKRDAIKHAINELDVLIDGCEPGANNNYPDGMQGINQHLEEQIQKRENLKHFIKQYC